MIRCLRAKLRLINLKIKEVGTAFTEGSYEHPISS
jgi:hypothetical protein